MSRRGQRIRCQQLSRQSRCTRHWARSWVFSVVFLGIIWSPPCISLEIIVSFRIGRPEGRPAILCENRSEVVMSIVREGLVKQRTWSEDELEEARQLLELCDRFEGLSLKLDIGM